MRTSVPTFKIVGTSRKSIDAIFCKSDGGVALVAHQPSDAHSTTLFTGVATPVIVVDLPVPLTSGLSSATSRRTLIPLGGQQPIKTLKSQIVSSQRIFSSEKFFLFWRQLCTVSFTIHRGFAGILSAPFYLRFGRRRILFVMPFTVMSSTQSTPMNLGFVAVISRTLSRFCATITHVGHTSVCSAGAGATINRARLIYF